MHSSFLGPQKSSKAPLRGTIFRNFPHYFFVSFLSKKFVPIFQNPLFFVSPRALWLVADFSCDCAFLDERGGGLARQPVGPFKDTATITLVMSTNGVDLGNCSSRYCTFRRTHTSADLIRLLCIRLALPLTLFLLLQFAPSERLMVDVPPQALWLAGVFLYRKKRCAGVVGTHIDQVLKGEGGGITTPLLHYVVRFDGGGEIPGFGWGGHKESRPWCSLFVGFQFLFVAPMGEQLASLMC